MHHGGQNLFCSPATVMSTRIETQGIKYKVHWTHLLSTSTIGFQCFKLTTNLGEQCIEQQYWISSSALAGQMRNIMQSGAQRCYDIGDGQCEQQEWIRRVHCLFAEKLPMLDSVDYFHVTSKHGHNNWHCSLIWKWTTREDKTWLLNMKET